MSLPVSAFSVYRKQQIKFKKRIESVDTSPVVKKTKKHIEQSTKQNLNGNNKIKTKIAKKKKVKKEKNKLKRKFVAVAETLDIDENFENEDDKPPILIPINTWKQNDLEILGKNKKKSKKNIKKIHETLTPKLGNHVSSAYEEEVGEVAPTIETIKLKSSASIDDPSTEGLTLFKWFISPVTPRKFFEKYWESEPLYIQRNKLNYYNHILTTAKLDNIIREYPLHYTRNVDVVSYENGTKQVFNQEGRAVASALWDYYSNGCSIRILNPQTYDQKTYLLIATLQEYFGTMVGTNVYLTPPGSQGFAPHYDDIEAFVVQLEGRKHWKLYKPSGKDVLARDSSLNFKSEDLDDPFMEVTLNAGDLLYFPRGTIHEGRTDPEAHSLHITVSVYQHTAFVDLLEHALPDALKRAAMDNLEFRKGLPFNYLKHVGCTNRNNVTKQRQNIVNKVKDLVKNLADYINVDLAADQLGKKFMYDCMPPALSKDEVTCTSRYDGDYIKNGKVYNRVEIGMDTKVRLFRYYCLRVVDDEISTPRIYYCTDNAKVYHGEEEQFLEVDRALLPCIEMLQNKYPGYVEVEELPIDDVQAKGQLVLDLWEKGLLVTDGPLASASEEYEEIDDEYVDSDSD